MKRYSSNNAPMSKTLLAFFLLVLVTSAFVWVAGPIAERLLQGEMPVDLPLSSLMAFCPAIAAVILVQREGGWDAVKKLFRRSLDPRIKGRIWLVPILFLMPAVVVVQYGLTNPLRVPIPDRQFPAAMVPVSVLMFLIAAVGEEMGWQGYVVDRLQARWSALTASIALGAVWAAWHIVPLLQLGRPPAWMVWQCLGMVASRILIVWMYNNTGKSVFSAVLYHAMNNVSTVLLPAFGLHYDPFVSCILIAVVAAIVTFLWGPETLARYKYARLGKRAQWRAAEKGARAGGA